MQFEEVFIDVPWGKLAVLLGGNPKGKPVFAVHGTLDSAGTFIPLVNLLPSGFRYIILDLPGCGRSDPFPPKNPLHTTDYIISLKYVVDFFKLEKFIYLSHSLGGILGSFLYQVYPELFEKFISLDIIHLLPIEFSSFPSYFKYAYEDYYHPKNYGKYAALTPSPTYSYDQALELIMKNRGLSETAANYALQRNIVSNGGDNSFRLTWDQRMKHMIIPMLSAEDWSQYMSCVRVPHLMVLAAGTGRRELRPHHLRTVDAHFKHNPDFQLVTVEGNHDVHLNSPGLVAKFIAPFMNGAKLDPKDIRATRDYLTTICKL